MAFPCSLSEHIGEEAVSGFCGLQPTLPLYAGKGYDVC